MARTEKLEKIRRAVAAGGGRDTRSLIGDGLAESGLLDRARLNQQIEAILQEDSRNPLAVQQIEFRLEALAECVDREDLPGAAEEATALLSLELDDLRKAALLSLMVRSVGKGRFDPVAAHILEKNQ